MALIEINRNPSRRDLILFGLLFLVFTGIVGAGLYFRRGAHDAARIVWIAGAAVMALYFAIPSLRRRIYLGWIYVTFPIGFVISHVILAAVFYLVVTPIGLLMRLLGNDPMHRRLDRAAATYWVEHDPHRNPARYFRQS
jgi:NADH:ubiquinone oxidoreductase subunit 6 (subunit J)